MEFDLNELNSLWLFEGKIDGRKLGGALRSEFWVFVASLVPTRLHAFSKKKLNCRTTLNKPSKPHLPLSFQKKSPSHPHLPYPRAARPLIVSFLTLLCWVITIAKLCYFLFVTVSVRCWPEIRKKNISDSSQKNENGNLIGCHATENDLKYFEPAIKYPLAFISIARAEITVCSIKINKLKLKLSCTKHDHNLNRINQEWAPMRISIKMFSSALDSTAKCFVCVKRLKGKSENNFPTLTNF